MTEIRTTEMVAQAHAKLNFRQNALIPPAALPSALSSPTAEMVSLNLQEMRPAMTEIAKMEMAATNIASSNLDGTVLTTSRAINLAASQSDSRAASVETVMWSSENNAMTDGILQAEMAAHQDAKLKMDTSAILNTFKSEYQDASEHPNDYCPSINHLLISILQ